VRFFTGSDSGLSFRHFKHTNYFNQYIYKFHKIDLLLSIHCHFEMDDLAAHWGFGKLQCRGAGGSVATDGALQILGPESGKIAARQQPLGGFSKFSEMLNQTCSRAVSGAAFLSLILW
jgi:hypothetical protein